MPSKKSIFTPLSILFRPHQKPVRQGRPVFGGGAGYRPRVRSAYYDRVYHHSWQASPSDIITSEPEQKRFEDRIRKPVKKLLPDGRV